ncbi:MAG: tRNA (adenosine(37)-N6)-threonylcarbamoyltransferase complex dimerization subunit type 1 TsaB [candidate division Zixibacteria bacterium]|nr:tRNA (adenosine(37)-N6)-threonylcarbamoyltransferase complex dimerization subunit type 1 TsaB [candidate division Zixibacteria bacterium]
MLILCLDSSDRILKTAIFEDEIPLAESSSDSMGNHSEKIISQIDELFSKTGRRLDDLNLLALNTGPGSFTGLRIGASAMAGLSMSKNVPLLGFNGFEIMVEDVSGLDGSYLFTIQCRGDEFYCMHVRISGASEDERIGPMIAVPSKIELPSDADKVEILGPGRERFLEKCPEEILHRLAAKSRFENSPTMNSLARLALDRFKAAPAAEFGIPEIYYMAPSQAEVNLARRKGNN